MASKLFELSQDFEGFDLQDMLCNKCTLGCNVFRIASRGREKFTLCGKKPETQEMLNAQRAQLGIPEPGTPLRS